MVKIGQALTSLHEISCFLPVPGALRLVENHNMVEWGSRGADSFIAKMMDVLNKLLYLPPDIAFAHTFATSVLFVATFAHTLGATVQFIASQRLLEYRDKGLISREEYRASLSELMPSRR